eukprot:5754174-Amphidinium_carterae.1
MFFAQNHDTKAVGRLWLGFAHQIDPARSAIEENDRQTMCRDLCSGQDLGCFSVGAILIQALE